MNTEPYGDSVLAKRVDKRHIHVDPLSDRSVRLIRHWMTKCESKHKECFDHPVGLPTRVIDVTGFTLKLLDPSPKSPHQYVTLSHCWGSCRSFLTTRDNVEERKRGFSIEELPATFRDAVAVTRYLGFPYLWIDSICILQGDHDDWEIEGGKMADVYANSTLTIAAANASDDAEGFLKPRDEGLVLTVDICLPSEDGDRLHDRATRIYTSLPPTPKLVYDPLDGRAWCLQERCLAPRILFFASDSLRWECLGNSWFEAGRGLPKKKLMLPDIMPERLASGDLSYVPWYKAVELYTTRAITYAVDKLPALSALASRVAEQYDDQYLAGLWKTDLILGLLWYRVVRRKFRDLEPTAPFQAARNGLQDYLAPSWSWASYPGAVQFQAIVISSEALHPLPSLAILEASVSVPGKNKYGQVESGVLVLRTPLLPLEPAIGGDTLSHGAWDHNDFYCKELEDFDIEVGSTFDYPEKKGDGRVFGVPLTFCEERDNSRKEEGPNDEGYDEGRKWVRVYGLLIGERREVGQNAYERAGCFKLGPIPLCNLLDVLDDLERLDVKII